MGFGIDWQDWTVLGPSQDDIAFMIGGTKGFEWKKIASINSERRSRPTAAEVNGKIYLIGGDLPDGVIADAVERYDATSNTWTTLSGKMPIPASNICAGVIVTDIYIPGGYEASLASLNTLQVYHTTSQTWTTITTDPLPVNLCGSGCAVLDNKLYVFGGLFAGLPQTVTYRYDPAAPAGSRWSSLAPMNSKNAYFGGIALNGKIYAVGGMYCSNCVEVYDPADGAWHIMPNLTFPRSSGPGVYGVGKTLYICGGGQWKSYLNSCKVYGTTQGDSGVWKMLPAYMQQGRGYFGYASIGPVLYAIAGFDDNYLNTSEKWSYEFSLPLITK